MFTQFVNYIQKNIGTSAVTLVTCPANNQLAINQLSCANVTGLSVTCSVTVTRAGVTIFILHNATVPAGGSLICVGESQKIVLMAGDVLQVQSSTASSIDCVVSGVLNDFNRAAAVPAPPTSPVATFSITPSTTSMREGDTVTYSVTTTNVPNGTVLYWQNFGTTSAQDFTDDRNDGEFVITGGAGSFTRTLRTTGSGGDPGGESAETIQIAVQFRPGYLGGGAVAGAATVTVIPDIVSSGLILSLDASNSASYPGTGTTWFDISGQGAHGTINGTVSYVASGLQSYFNFATASDSNFISSTASQPYLDVTIVFRPDFSRTQVSNIAGLIGNNTPASNADKSLRFGGVNGTGPWSLAARNPGDANDWAFPNPTTYYVNGSASNIVVEGWNILGGFRTNQASFPLNFSYHLGSSSYVDRSFQGRIAAVYMYNRQLSAAEQQQNFNALRGRFGL
jgi:hypothetical protein